MQNQNFTNRDNVKRTIKNKIKPHHLDNYFKNMYFRTNKYNSNVIYGDNS